MDVEVDERAARAREVVERGPAVVAREGVVRVVLVGCVLQQGHVCEVGALRQDGGEHRQLLVGEVVVVAVQAAQLREAGQVLVQVGQDVGEEVWQAREVEEVQRGQPREVLDEQGGVVRAREPRAVEREVVQSRVRQRRQAVAHGLGRGPQVVVAEVHALYCCASGGHPLQHFPRLLLRQFRRCQPQAQRPRCRCRWGIVAGTR